MSVREYIGARYVPKFMGLYDPTEDYEALSVVDNGLGTSYISKVPTPAGTPLTDTNYWIISGSTNGAIIQLQEEVNRIKDNATVAAMQSNTDLAAGDVTRTSGFYNAADGGAATYIVDNVGVADGIFNIGLSNGLIAHLVYGDDVNILQLGAHNDGLTDDTLIIQSALNNARHIIIPEGTFLISNTLVPVAGNVISGSFDGFDRSKSTIKTTSNITMFRFSNGSITINNLELEHENTQTAPVCDFTAAKYIKMMNVKFTHSGSNCIGIYADPSSVDWCGYLHFDTVYCSDYLNNVNINATLITFENCKLNNATSNNIVFDGEIINLIGCDLRSNSDIPPVKYSGKYGVNMSGCYDEYVHVQNLIDKSNPVAYVKNNGCKCTWSETANTYNDVSRESIWHPEEGADPSVLSRFKDGTEGDDVLINGAFDFDTFAWTMDNDANAVVQSSDAPGYKNELYCQFSGGANIIQSIGNLPRGRYTLSFWVKFEEAGDNFTFDLYVGEGTGTSKYYARVPIRNHQDIPNNEWRLVTCVFNSTNDPTVTTLNIRFRCNATVPKMHLTGVCLTRGINTQNVSRSVQSYNNAVLTDRLFVKGTDDKIYVVKINNGTITADALT